MEKNKTNQTITFYNENSQKYIEDTLTVDFSYMQNKFLSYLAPNAHILDFGCGSGRDSKYFLSKGFEVTAIDGSKQLCDFATRYSGIQVKNIRFQDFHETNKYDGIWACSSILHLTKNDLEAVFNRMYESLKKHGYVYTSFKYGNFEGERNGRYFTDFTEETFDSFLSKINLFSLIKTEITSDVRPDRNREKWLNVILQRK